MGVTAEPDDDPGLPFKLWPCSNGEYLPAPLDDLRREAMRRASEAADHHARRHGWSRRRFLLSSAGMASGLAVLQACSDERSRSLNTEPGGRFTVPETAATDPEHADEIVHGEASTTTSSTSSSSTSTTTVDDGEDTAEPDRADLDDLDFVVEHPWIATATGARV